MDSKLNRSVIDISICSRSISDQNSSETGKESHEKKFLDKNFTTKRHLKSRHIQLIAIGGSIGTGLFVTIATGLIKGGAAGLLIATVFWTCVMLLLTSAVGEMVVQYPAPSPFVEMAGRCIDEAVECAAGWNFFLMEALYIPFEITAVSSIIDFWRDDYSAAIPISIIIALYTAINVFNVKYFGESEFWLSIGKLILCVGLLFFTLITMCGGNPAHDAFGFRYFKIDPFGSGYVTTGGLGKFEGWLGALFQANFFVVGPEYISMIANEAHYPVRKNLSTCFKTVIWRLCLFYIGGALSVGILIAYNNPTLVAANTAGESSAAASPYVIAMENLNIKVLPDIVNAIILLSALSAGNSYFFCSSRQLYSLSKRGFAPAFFQICTSSGVPIFCILVVIAFACLSFMELGTGGSLTALTYITSICTKSQMLNYLYMGVTYIAFYHACKAQGIDKSTYAYRSWFQPYSAYIVTFFLLVLCGVQGYTVFLPGWWSVEDFIFYYIMIFVNVAIYIFWKVIKRTPFRKSSEVDLVSGLKEIEEYEYEHFKIAEEAQINSDTDSEDYKKKNAKEIFNNVKTWIF
ncbi:hypothetical protein PACTADRAFT_50127 [Pachysolen tannophilus NRRL Y-2460]|uniref:Amino acid permease/ SLC12A domain-containing protein n=1 Tax=Pachysolen tannophilus NRRL Y-2460 TaxID=669874 RepID=A0A1E4TUH7_PACTA|nr:hypothetical protein PACTADRAFT_50127 [Pachysolen tannophilus NRRL Y-2460]